MKLTSRLVIVLLVCLMVIPILAVPVQADEGDPYITLSPTSGHPGEELTVRGYDFESREDVYIYYYRGATTSSRVKVETARASTSGSFKVSFTISESCTGAHRVRADGDEGSDVSEDFTIEPGLEINPEEGPVGTTVIVTGTGFEKDEEDIELRYYLKGSEYSKVADDITADEYGSWETSFTAPPSSKGDHKIDATGDYSSLSEVEDATFSIEPGISLSKSSGYVGDTITVSGSGFRNKETMVKVTYDDEQVGSSTTADNNGAWIISFPIPPSTRGKHEIDAYGRSTLAADITDKDFTVSPKITLEPTEGHVGISLNLDGAGFAGSKLVTVTYDGVERGSATTDNKGSFSSVAFPAPRSRHGNHTVNATDAVGNKDSAIFTMESVPPAKPVLSSPGDGSRAGLIGAVTPTFEWSTVTDESGVTYSLQIASTEIFSAPSVSLTGLNEASYTLSKEQALSHGTYYWRVKAIDGAQNDSGWTSAYSVRAGLLPLWAFIAIIVLLVVLIGALVYFFAIKKKVSYD